MSQAAVVQPHPRAQPRVLADVIGHSRVRDAALVLSAALLTAACAQISIPLPGDPVPITGQTFAVLLTGAALGANRGALGQLSYVAMGLVGLPFYADGASGWDVVWGATGGYLVGFIIAAWVIGRLAEARLDRSPLKALPLFTIGSLIIFAIGVPWLAVSADLSLGKAIELGFVPFIPGGIVKALLAAGLLPTAWRLVGRAER
jgi:biotin transport system substrate-specific component